MLSREHLDRQVKDALRYLYDPVHLETHPLVDLILADDVTEGTRGLCLREDLVEIIELLRPADRVPFGHSDWLSYRILRESYIEARCPSEVWEDLALSRTTYYRHLREALRAVTNILADRYLQTQTAAPKRDNPGPAEPSGLAQPAATESARRSHLQRTELVTLLESVKETVRPLFAQVKGDFAFGFPALLPAIRMDPAALRQIILSLLSEGIELATFIVLRLTIQLEDGVSLWKLRGLVASSLPEECLGEGDGLAVTRSLLDPFGGSLWAELEPENELVLCFTLPIEQRQSILIVDDNRETQSLYQRYIEEGGFIASLAGDVHQIARCLEQIKPDLILLDLLLPGEDGWKILQDLRSSPDTAKIPVIVCSVLTEPRLALALGAQAVLQKPIHQADLLRTVMRLLA